MSTFFFDTSAIVKRYFPETGTTWVQSLTDPFGGHIVILAEITLVEVAAASAAKYRASGGITRQERDGAVNLFLHHCATQYELIPASRSVIDRAVYLTQTYRLRGYDAVQLASALVGNDHIVDRFGSNTRYLQSSGWQE